MHQSITVCVGALLTLLLSACAAPGNWSHPQYSKNPVLRDQQFTIDNGYCKQTGQGSSPVPNINVAPSTPSNYYVTGNSTAYGTGGISNSTYNATVTPVVNPVSSLMGGYAQGAALGAMLRAKRDQEEIYRGCMTRLGWMPQ